MAIAYRLLISFVFALIFLMIFAPGILIGYNKDFDFCLYFLNEIVSGFEVQISMMMIVPMVLLLLVPRFFLRKKSMTKKYRKHLDLNKMSWREFEHLTSEYFSKRGFRSEVKGGAGGDGGIDVMLYRGQKRWIVQCKHWKTKKVGISIIREMYGSGMHFKADGVKIVSSGDFTKGCYEFAKNKNIELINGAKLKKGLI